MEKKRSTDTHSSECGIQLLTRLYEDLDAGHEAADLGEVARRHYLRVKHQCGLIVVYFDVLDHGVQAVHYVRLELYICFNIFQNKIKLSKKNPQVLRQNGL